MEKENYTFGFRMFVDTQDSFIKRRISNLFIDIDTKVRNF